MSFLELNLRNFRGDGDEFVLALIFFQYRIETPLGMESEYNYSPVDVFWF